MLHSLEDRLGSCRAHAHAPRRARSDRVVLLVGAGVCALAVQTAQLGVQFPALAGCASVHRRDCAVGGSVRCIVEFGQVTVLCIQVADVRKAGGTLGTGYGLIGAQLGALPCADRPAVC